MNGIKVWYENQTKKASLLIERLLIGSRVVAYFYGYFIEVN
ncbi:hypothetical protein D051_5222 [Vibrio parahaemolyticus VPCR-2010]|nr:hypothetical protein D051_5222 [Vibrio parahaemolyticus VPCR-2010]